MIRIEEHKEINEMWVYANNRKNKIASIDFDEKLKKEVSKWTWTHTFFNNRKKEYFKNSSPAYYLHQLVIDYYYGKEERKYLKERGFVIEHIDNNGVNNRIENLKFLSNKENLSERTTDKNIKDGMAEESYGVKITKDFKTGKYLLAIASFYEVKNYHFVYKDFETLKYDLEDAIVELKETKQLKQVLENNNYEKIVMMKKIKKH